MYKLKLPLLSVTIAFVAISTVASGFVQAQTETDATTSVTPNANLLVQGIPAVPKELAEKVARYTRFSTQSFVAWHPLRREMVVSYRRAGASTAQLFTLDAPAGSVTSKPEQLTDFSEPIASATYEPSEGKYLVFARGSGGNEAYQLYRLDLQSAAKESVQFTNPRERHAIGAWAYTSPTLLFSSVLLDKKGEGEEAKNDGVTTKLSVIDPRKPDSARLLAELPGGGWGRFRYSRDDQWILAQKYVSANESEAWLIDAATGKPKQLVLGSSKSAMSVNAPVGFRHEGNKATGVYVLTDRFGEFNELALVDLELKTTSRITADIPWDIISFSQSEDGKHLAAIANVDGRNELRLFDGESLKPVALPPNLPAGSVGAASFHRKLPTLALSFSSAKSPNEIHTLDMSDRSYAQWSRSAAPRGLDLSGVTEQSVVRWKSFDGREISGLLNLPPAKFTGKLPVLINIHGGPESQAKIGFLGRTTFYLNELGVAVIQPNVRGSSGYGKTFLALDNGMLREDSVKDIGALLDWIAKQPNLDASRVLVAGGSYGGYMSLAVATNYPERIAGAIDTVGISHFVTFLQNTETYRRELRRVEYGDERIPAMREHLEKISPLTNAHKIKKPLFVVQGKNDPRVPFTEAEQIVAKARANGTQVWYLRGENEGHGFARKENQDFQFYATVMFMEQTILK